jgi:rubrerythrin
MQQFESVEDLLEFAIQKEQEASEFYLDLASQMEKPHMREVFEGFAAEEQRHKAKLEGVRKGEVLKPSEDKIMDLKLADYLVEVELESEDMSYQQALVIAMKREKAAFKLYNDLAQTTGDDNLRLALMALAQEEAKHKLRMEIAYDEEILGEG